MVLSSLSATVLTELHLTRQASLKTGDKTALAPHLIDPLLALLRSDQIQATHGEVHALRGLETRLRSLRCESFSEFLGRDLLALAQDYLYSVTFQPLALRILNTLQDSSLPQAAAAASLLNSFQGTGGSLGEHLGHQLRRVTQTETLIPMAAAIATGSLAGSFFRAGITGMLRDTAVARLGGGAALHALGSAGGLVGNAAMFPLGLGAGNSLTGQASGLESLHSYSKSFLHGLTLMGTLGAAGWLGRSFRWGLHGTRFVRGVEQATRFQSLTKLTAATIPFSAEIGGLTYMNSHQESGKLGSYYFASALSIMLECRLGGGLAHGLAPGLHHVRTLLDQQAYRWTREGITRSLQSLRNQIGRTLPPSNNNSMKPSGLTPALAASAAGNISAKVLPNKIETSNPLQGPVHTYATGNYSGGGAGPGILHITRYENFVREVERGQPVHFDGLSQFDRLSSQIDLDAILEITQAYWNYLEEVPMSDLLWRARVRAYKSRLKDFACSPASRGMTGLYFWSGQENLRTTLEILTAIQETLPPNRPLEVPIDETSLTHQTNALKNTLTYITSTPPEITYLPKDSTWHFILRGFWDGNSSPQGTCSWVLLRPNKSGRRMEVFWYKSRYMLGDALKNSTKSPRISLGLELQGQKPNRYDKTGKPQLPRLSLPGNPPFTNGSQWERHSLIFSPEHPFNLTIQTQYSRSREADELSFTLPTPLIPNS